MGFPLFEDNYSGPNLVAINSQRGELFPSSLLSQTMTPSIIQYDGDIGERDIHHHWLVQLTHKAVNIIVITNDGAHYMQYNDLYTASYCHCTLQIYLQLQRYFP